MWSEAKEVTMKKYYPELELVSDVLDSFDEISISLVGNH